MKGKHALSEDGRVLPKTNRAVHRLWIIVVIIDDLRLREITEDAETEISEMVNFGR